MVKALALILATMVPFALITTSESEAVRPRSGPEPIGEAIAPYPYVSAGSRSRVYFKMLPGTKGQDPPQRGMGRAYRVGLKGDVLLWKTEGWYSWNTYLGAAGRFLVRVEGTFVSGAPSTKDIGIAFYDKGKLLRSYSTMEILKDRPWRKQWFLGNPQPFLHTDRPSGFTRIENDDPGDTLGFEIYTCDNYRSVFNIRTGELVRQDLVEERLDD